MGCQACKHFRSRFTWPIGSRELMVTGWESSSASGTRFEQRQEKANQTEQLALRDLSCPPAKSLFAIVIETLSAKSFFQLWIVAVLSKGAGRNTHNVVSSEIQRGERFE